MNWGLGHASRMIPVISQMLNHSVEVVIAASGNALELLRAEFPQLKFFELPGYEIKYYRSKMMVLQILIQLPGILKTYFNERKWLHKIIDSENIDAVISDNRFGLYSNKIYSVFVTHQINIKMPWGIKWLEKFIYKLNRRNIERFDECWIPDYGNEQNLSGDLSHKFPLPVNAKYIGPISRFSKAQAVKKIDVLIVLSGPEPQRTYFEKLLMQQIAKCDLRILLVRGTSMTEERKNENQIDKSFKIVDLLKSDELNSAFLSSEILVARSGYSTIMDLAATGKNAILIPTPGQTEQEYLAQYFTEKGIFFSQAQKDFDLAFAIKQAKNFTALPKLNDFENYRTSVAELVLKL